ncbi:MAG: 50S ribosomal protein L30 [Gammaproteobacteria bacterium RIFCSPHIGHO2_02_FULL_42_13]|nr:MAG: 50S ribosomal protein L30 [Gammaproteobacteria bacterium RIFCSPHIGHO2_02_FULL_42_13]OGT68465.1 MAG: 50S ribosomal protein L30 [Gammaproteobacteria bacterium RIFCSPLOWO2_02_FULL_42_9]
MKTANKAKQINVTLIKSKYGRLKGHLDCIHGLGLRRMHQTISIQDTPSNRGMINKVLYLLQVEDK